MKFPIMVSCSFVLVLSGCHACSTCQPTKPNSQMKSTQISSKPVQQSMKPVQRSRDNAFESEHVEKVSWQETNLPATEASVHSSRIRTMVDESEIQTALSRADGPVILDFYAGWCGPCKQQTKVLDEIESGLVANRATVIKIDIEKFPGLAKAYQVKSLPTLVIKRNHKTIERISGFTPSEKLLAIVRQSNGQVN